MSKKKLSISISKQFHQHLEEIKELNRFKSFSETLEYFFQNSVDLRYGLDRMHFDQCHREYKESLTLIRKIGHLFNVIARNIHMNKDITLNMSALENLLILNQDALKKTTQHLVAIEEVLNINNSLKKL